MTLEQLTTFLAWCTAINLGLLILWALALIVPPVRAAAVRTHAALLGVDPGELPRLYLQSLASYKMLWLVFNLVPYLVLRLFMGV